MARIESWFRQDLKEPVHVQMIQGNVFSQDEQANLIGVTVTEGGEAATLSGSVAASIIRADGATVAQAGMLSGNRCSVILPAAAYAVPGPLIITLKLTLIGVVTTLLAVVTTVYRTSTDAVVDPGTLIPSVQELIEDIEDATAAIPVAYNACFATAYSTSGTYVVGDYVTYDGYLYRCVTAISSGESWTAAHWTRVTFGGEVTDLKSAMDFQKGNKNIKAGQNCFDIASWLNSVGTEYTYEDGVYTFLVNARLVEKYIFSDEDIDVIFSCNMTVLSGSNQQFRFFNKNGEQVGTNWFPGDPPQRYKASSLCMNYGSQGDVTISDISLLSVNLSNEQLTEGLNALGKATSNETAGKNIADFKAYLDASGMTYTVSNGVYTVTVSAKGARAQRFSASNIPVKVSCEIMQGTGTRIGIELLDTEENVVQVLTSGARWAKAVACGYRIRYGNSGTAMFKNFTVEVDNGVSDSFSNGIRNKIENAMPVTPPDGFSWTTAPIIGKLFTDGRGKFFVDGFDVSEYMVNPSGGVDYYVNPYGGSDSGYDGKTPQYPFATVSKAYSMEDVRTIYCIPGVYGRTDAPWALSGITKSVNIVGLGGDVIFTNDWSIGWTAEGTANIVKKTTSLVPERIVDILHKDPMTGNYYNFAQKATLQEVYNTEYSFASVNGVLYAHVSTDNLDGWKNVVCSRGDDGNVVIKGECSVYFENIKIIGGKTPIAAEATDSTHAPSFYAKDCEFWYGQGDASYRNAVTMRGTRLTIFQRCKAMCNGGTDGFNYHTYYDVVPKAIEIDCQGIGNGDDPDGSDQGSTIHEGTIIIRVNGIYCNNHGANIGDQTGDEVVNPSESWNLGCVCFASKSQTSAQNGNFMAYNRTKMWLDGCVGYSSTGNLAGDLSNMKIRLPQFYGELKAPQSTGDPTVY